MDHFIWNMDPVMVSFMGLTIHWYGVLFATAIASGFQVIKHIYVREGLDVESLDNLLIYCVVGIVLGARLGHVLFYDPGYYFAHPAKILAIWEGGLASHGGTVGVVLAMYYYKLKVKLPFLFLLDRLAIATGIFCVFVRLGNLANSEILGVATDKPWGIIFERIDMVPRHPAQLYEALAYLVIFITLWLLYRYTEMKRREGALVGLFLALVFGARYLIEFVKVRQAEFALDWSLSVGQMLSVPFVLAGLTLLVMAYLRPPRDLR
ncbi:MULTISPECIES: prolipoprotein diacylglyceryl transferase [Shewanella]|uniref:Phosphatidylglycerol--prolipoprotein diacylglyceryl transferase n=1 Tax=Shewanella marisflavi TaxID=260364 RepID=A0ABX5WQ31_9GAMM|nr:MULTISPECIES: prolipoprotein diacylglyceryl transferase [Shewanella]QDF76522.1 prolipoprotein diacylglyceryl transferase [Shewanella marisflavi]